MTESSTRSDQPTRAGYVTLVGPPNAGKSTLLNALVGERLSIVTPKAQTTWQRITGLRTSGSSQMIFLDTPGLLDPNGLLQEAMASASATAVAEADVLVVVVDASRRLPETAASDIERKVPTRGTTPCIVALNKTDLADPERTESLARWAEGMDATPLPVSATRGTGIDALLTHIEDALPESPFLYPDDEIATAPVRFFVAELVRETVFERYGQEIPYSLFCRVEEFREDRTPIYIAVEIYVERASQKGILIGKGGRAIRDLGTRARHKIEHFLSARVYLDLWVKVLPGWRRKREALRRFGLEPPEERDSGR